VSKNLVLARVGAASLHPGWLDGATSRDWDLILLPYQPIAPQAKRGCEVRDVVPGPKWSGLRSLLHGWDGWRAYDRIWMPDDDLAADGDTITRLFATAEALGLDLFAPALDERSAFAHYSTMRNACFHARMVGFVEIMAPGFSRAALEELLPTLDESETGWGWGLDSVWPKLLGYRRVGVVDGTPVLHTRPVGQMRDAELARRVLAESDGLLARYGCRQEHVTFGAVGEDLQALALTPEALLAELVGGWGYLIERDPRILAWIADAQLRHHPPPPYPVEGTP
jgi:hypothetical protein